LPKKTLPKKTVSRNVPPRSAQLANFHFQDIRQCTLTPEGFEYLLDLNILKSDCVDTATILDKGKADFLAKFLVCVQAAWMVIQCILRKLKGLPITLIELNTLLHVIIALIMYWFCK
jgi:hypothetical protein